MASVAANHMLCAQRCVLSVHCLSPFPLLCFRCERFHLVKKYEVEFNKAAISLADQMTNPHQKKATMNRLLKVGPTCTLLPHSSRSVVCEYTPLVTCCSLAQHHPHVVCSSRQSAYGLVG